MKIRLHKSEKVALISRIDEDLHYVDWWFTNGYAGVRLYRGGENRMLYMHQAVMERVLSRNLVRGEVVDHINGDRLDNRRSNLRVATYSQNSRNRAMKPSGVSGFVGVHRCTHSSHSWWVANTKVRGRTIRFGCYSDPLEAAWMRDQLVLGLFDEFTRTNFEYRSLT